MITLVEAGLDWKPLEAQSAHNQRQTKDFPSFSGFYLGGCNESCTAHQIYVPYRNTDIDSVDHSATCHLFPRCLCRDRCASLHQRAVATDGESIVPADPVCHASSLLGLPVSGGLQISNTESSLVTRKTSPIALFGFLSWR